MLFNHLNRRRASALESATMPHAEPHHRPSLDQPASTPPPPSPRARRHMASMLDIRTRRLAAGCSPTRSQSRDRAALVRRRQLPLSPQNAGPLLGLTSHLTHEGLHMPTVEHERGAHEPHDMFVLRELRHPLVRTGRLTDHHRDGGTAAPRRRLSQLRFDIRRSPSLSVRDAGCIGTR